MLGKDFQRKYALTDQGLKNVKKGALWTVVTNLVVMGGVGILYLMMTRFMGTLTSGAALPGPWLFVGMAAAFVVLSMLTHLEQYKATYGLVYGEVRATRLGLAERLRKLPLGYFGKRDLADLTETIMGDVNRMEHVWSHALGYLYGSYISTAIIAVMVLAYLPTFPNSAAAPNPPPTPVFFITTGDSPSPLETRTEPFMTTAKAFS